ncbi:MAG: methyltransferase domain-containing protein [Dehalococcoidia bacterium]|nr:MAG: methyltransferase domain-containing protein [Dehalococcoidia bacterium]
MNLFDADNLDAASALLELHWQFRASRVLMTAHQLGIFTALEEPGTAAQVAEKCSTDLTMTEKMLVACCALGVVRRDGDRFQLTQLAKDTLLPESYRYMGGVLDHGEALWWSSTGLPDLIRTGERLSGLMPPEHYITHWHEHWIRAMHGIAANGVGQWVAQQVDLSDRKLMLDVGGGPGTYSIAMCQRFPNLRAVVWDVPRTIAIAREVIDRFKIGDRITVQEGDWNQDEFGTGYDCLFLSNIMHGPTSQAETRLGQAMRALEPEGLLIVHDFLMNNDRSGPLPAALFNLMIGAYTVNELITVVRSTGFNDVSLIAYNAKRGSGLITAVKP